MIDDRSEPEDIDIPPGLPLLPDPPEGMAWSARGPRWIPHRRCTYAALDEAGAWSLNRRKPDGTAGFYFEAVVKLEYKG